MIFWESFFFLLFLYVDSLFSEMNVVSFFPLKKNTIYRVDVLFSAHSCKWNFFITVHLQIFSYFTNILWDKKVYSHAYLTICFIELACYGSRDNVLEQIIWIWNWRKFRLSLRYMILTSAALNPLSCFLFPFVFSFALFWFPLSSWAVFVTFCVEVGSLFAWLFYSVQATKQSIQIVFYVTRGKTSDRCLFCFSGLNAFFYKFI